MCMYNVCMREATGMIFIGGCVHTCTFRCLHSWRTLCVELETSRDSHVDFFGVGVCVLLGYSIPHLELASQ